MHLKNGVPLLIFLFYLFWAGSNVAFHEVWRDEVHAWAIAKAGHSIQDVLIRSDYEGHPSLWYLLLYLLQFFSRSVDALQWFHFALIAGAVSLLILYSPFAWWQKAMITGSYFIVYEYAALARNYAVELLLLFAFCAMYPLRRKPRMSLTMSGILFLLMISNAFGLLFGLGLSALLVLESFKTFRAGHWTPWVLVLLSAGSICVAVADIIPPADCVSVSAWKTIFDYESFLKAVSAIWNGYIPVPRMETHFWNTNFLDPAGDATPDFARKALLTLPVLLVIALLLRHKPLLLLLFWGFTCAFLFFIYAQYFGYMRHHGHFFIAAIVSLWLAYADGTQVNRLHKCWLAGGFGLILAAQSAGAGVATWYEKKYIFSPDEQAARLLIQQHGFHNALWVNDFDYIGEGVAGILDKPLYSAASRQWSTYVTWDKKRCYNPFDLNAVEVGRLLREAPGKKEVWLLLHYPPDSTLRQLSGFREVAHFSGCIERSEVFGVYHWSVDIPGR